MTIEPVATALPDPLHAVPALAERDDPYLLYLASLDSVESRRSMAGCLDRIAALLLGGTLGERVDGRGRAWWLLRYRHTGALRAQLVDSGWSPSHVNKHIYALRGVLDQCWKLGLMTAEEQMRARDIKTVKGSRLPAGRSIHADEHAAIETACRADDSLIAVRDEALIAVLRSTGVRRHEAAGMLIEKYDRAERTIRVLGKGNKEREVYLYPSSAATLDRWLARLDRRTGPMFPPIDRWGNVTDRHMDPRSVGAIVDRRRRAAGVAPLSTHDYRRTVVGELIDVSDLVVAQRITGHASVATTAAYDRRPGRAARAAVDRLDPQGAS